MASINTDSACLRVTDSEPLACPVGDKPTSLLTDSDINKIVERKLCSNNFRVLHWSLDSLGETNGFLGSYYTLTVAVMADDKSTQLKFFAKALPVTRTVQYKYLIEYNTFNKEIIIYDDMIPRMGRGNGFKWAPDYYFGKSNSIIVLEDAKESGYVMLGKHEPFDVEHCVWMLRALSIFHSRSLILDEKLRRSTGQTIMDLYSHVLEELCFLENAYGQRYLDSSMKAACALVDILEGVTDEQRAVIRKRIATWILKCPKLMESSSKFRNLACHRDMWVNNIMFKKDSAGKPIGCYIIDYQFMRYNPPAIDFLLSLYLNTVRAARDENFELFVDVYCDTMKSELASEGLNMEECLPRAEFVKSCEELRNTALVFSIISLPVMLLSTDVVQKYFVNDDTNNLLYGDIKADVVLSQCRSLKAYRTRLMEILEEIKERMPDNPANC